MTIAGFLSSSWQLWKMKRRRQNDPLSVLETSLSVFNGRTVSLVGDSKPLEKRARTRPSKLCKIDLPAHLTINYAPGTGRANALLRTAVGDSHPSAIFLIVFQSKYSTRNLDLLLPAVLQYTSQYDRMFVIQVQHTQNPPNDKENLWSHIHTVSDSQGLLAKSCRVLDPLGGGNEPLDCIVIVDAQINKQALVLCENKEPREIVRELDWLL